MSASTAELLLTLFKWSETTGFILMLLFIIQYTFLGKWWKNPIGRTIVVETVAILLVLFPSILHAYFGVTTRDSAGFAWYTLVSFSMIPFIFLGRIISFELIRRKLKKIEWRNHGNPQTPDVSGGDVPAPPREG